MSVFRDVRYVITLDNRQTVCLDSGNAQNVPPPRVGLAGVGHGQGAGLVARLVNQLIRDVPAVLASHDGARGYHGVSGAVVGAASAER